MALTGGPSLPAGEVNWPYSYDLKQLLSVTGDNNWSTTNVSWNLPSGSLPAGLSLGTDGVLSGVPTTKDSVGASFRLLSVYARGTSYYAYDGSGPVKRDKTNACLATFSNGRRYNADLNGAQNIAARGLAILLGLKPHKEVSGVVRKGSPGRAGKSSGRPTRIPLVLADIWAHARMSAGHTVTATGVSLDAPTTARSA